MSTVKIYTINITWRKLTIYHALLESNRLGMTTEFSPKKGMSLIGRKTIIKDKLIEEGLNYHE